MLPTAEHIMRNRNSTYLQEILRVVAPRLNVTPNVTWTNMPLALSDLYAGTASDIPKMGYGTEPLIYFDFGALLMNIATAGSAGATIKLQYSIDGGGVYNDVPNASFLISTTGQKMVAFPIPDDAKGVAECFLRVMGIGGNGVADPVFLTTSGNNSVIFGVQSLIAGVTLDPVIFSSQARNRRQMQFRNQAWSFGTLTWTNMPLAQTEWFGVTTRRLNIDLTSPGYELVKLTFNMSVAGAANATMRMQYSLDGGTNWSFIDSETGNTGAPCNIGATGMRQSTSYVIVDQAAKNPAQLCRFVGQGGDGVADPQFTGGTTGSTFGIRFSATS